MNIQKINKAFSPINTVDRPSAIKPARSNWHRFHPKRIVLLVGFLILIGILGFVLYNYVNTDQDNSPHDEVRDVLSLQTPSGSNRNQ